MQICKENTEFQFLLDDLLLEEMDSKRVKTKQTPKAKEPSEKSTVVKNSISSFFGKSYSVCFKIGYTIRNRMV